MAARKLGQKDLTRPKCEEDSSGTGKLDEVSPAMRTLDRTNVFTWRMFMASSTKAAIHLGPFFFEKKNSETTRIQNSRTSRMCSTTLRRKKKIWRNSECEMPGLFITIMDVSNTVQRQGDQVGEFQFCILFGWNTNQEPQKQDGKDKLNISRRNQENQDSVGLDGEAIEFEWKSFPGFTTLTVLQKIQKDLEEKNIKPEKWKYWYLFRIRMNRIEKTRAGALTFVPNKASLNTRKIISTNEKKWITVHAHSGRGSDKTKERLMDRDIGRQLNQYW